MRTILLFVLVSLVVISGAIATPQPLECSNGANLIANNPEMTIAVCDDPTDQTCEQDFQTICPANWHLCSVEEYNTGNDNWQGQSNGMPMLGEIQCRGQPGAYSGAGHFSVGANSVIVNYADDQVNNQWAGSSLPECPSSYGCNEQQYYALCCYGEGNGEIPPQNEIPEFGLLGAVLIIAGAAGFLIFRRK